MMSQANDRENHRAFRRQAEIAKLRSLENEAIHRGLKLGPRDRLMAAFHLARIWGEAKKAGLRKDDFQDAIFGRLKRQHGSRQEFRLSNWTLKRGEDPTTQPGLVKEYQTRATPQKALEPYLVGIAVAAEHCGEDADDWKLAMVRDLSIWSRQSEGRDLVPPDERPFETLAVLLNGLCTRLAKDNRLSKTFEAIRAMNCHWEMFSEQLAATDVACMQRIESPISPVFEDNMYFEEMFPFPSIPLLRVPYGVGNAIFALAPEDELRSYDSGNLLSGCYNAVGLPFRTEYPVGVMQHYNIPDDARGLLRLRGDFTWYREIRLAIAADGSEQVASVLESRPRMEVSFARETPFEGRHHVLHGYEIELERGLYYGRGDDGGYLFPNIQAPDGRVWRIKMDCDPESGPRLNEWTERYPDSTGWFFEPDPVNHPGQVFNEPWYLSYTPATPPYLRHWLKQDWRLGNEAAVCPWRRNNLEFGTPEARWDRNLPPINALNFPDFSYATWIECCLHNGLIAEALKASIDNLTEQTMRLQADWYVAREHHSNALLRRWNNETKQEGH
jgi:hypothetical protein